MRNASLPGKQKLSSPSAGRAVAPLPSWSPAGQAMGLPWLSSPNGVAGIGVGPRQNWKCPISSASETFSACAAQITRVFSEDVLYIGWKLYGIAVQLVPRSEEHTSELQSR